MPLTLLWLALGTFAIGTESFLIAGLLPAIAADLAVSSVAAGHLITFFALSYALGAPLMAVVTGRFDRRSVLLLSLALFALANVAAALAPSYSVLLVLRIAMACFSGLFSPMAAALAGSLVPPAQRGRALALVAAGTTVAIVLGVPFGTLIGNLFGWRASFLAVAALGGTAWLGIAFGLPRVAAPPASTLTQRLAPLGQPAIRRALLMTVAWIAGAFTVYTYLTAYFTPLGMAGAAFAAVLALFGIGSFAGNLLGGWATDRFGSLRVLRGALGLLAIALAALSAAPHLPHALWIALALTGAWAVIGWSALPARQAQLIALAPQTAPLLLALNASAIYLGVASGSALGGVVLAYGDPGDLGWVAALTELAALTLLAAERRHTPALQTAAA